MTDYKWLDCVRYKEVLVFGKQVRTKIKSKYIAVDEGGCVYAYKSKPQLMFERNWWKGDVLDAEYLGKIEMKPEYDWTTMIVEV